MKDSTLLPDRHTLKNAALVLLLATPLPATSSEPPSAEPPAEAERSELGISSLVLQKGHGQRNPDGNDLVAFHFTLWTAAGAQLDTSYGAEKPPNFLMEKLSPPYWRETLAKMVAGEKRRLWVPARLAPKRPDTPSGAVICDLELLAFRRIPNLSPAELKPPEDAKKTRFGAFVSVLEPAPATDPEEKIPEGKRKIEGPQSTGALAHYTLFTADGKVFDTSVVRNRPTLFPYEKVMPAFADAVQQMTEGERSRIWIPGNVANGQWVRSPKGALIFEVKVIRFLDADFTQTAQNDSSSVPGD